MEHEEYRYYFQKRPEMLSFIPKSCMRFLEVGCGDGSFSSQLKQKEGVEVWGVEMHPETGLAAQQLLDKVFIGDFETFLEGNELPDSYFDCIIFNDVLEHFIDPHGILLKIKRILKPAGYITSSLPNFRYVGNLWEILVDGDFRYKDSGILDRSHYRFFTEKSIRAMYAQQGYEIQKISGINPTKSFKVRIVKWLSFNKLADIPFMQIATLVRLKN